MFGIGVPELLIILAIVLVIFGVGKLPQIGSALGKGISNFKKAVSGSDCGTVVNPDLAAGQLEGGLSKGLGYALIEDNEWDADGQLLSKGYWVDGKTPGITESPLLENLSVHFADTYEPTGPLGAKGLGEAAMNPVAAAYANAIYDATGVRFRELPITPEKIMAALAQQAEEVPA